MSTSVPSSTIRAQRHAEGTDQHRSDMANSEVMEHGEVHERIYDNDDNEDPATQAASENLKHASISEKEPLAKLEGSAANAGDLKPSDDPDKESARPITPEAVELSDIQDEEMKERLSSPKKKRGREQDEEGRDLESAGSVEVEGASPNGNAINGGRTTRLAPEKKRHRDASVDTVTTTETGTDSKEGHVPEAAGMIKADKSVSESSKAAPETSSRPVFGSGTIEKAQTSTTAFANSGFGSFAASSTSGFAALAASKPSIFGSGTPSQVSGFGALSGGTSVIPDTSKVKMSFGSTGTEPLGTTPTSGFGNITTTGFGALGSGFGGGFAGFTGGSGPKLSSFATSRTADIVGAEKPAKAFGAPESDEEEDSDEDDESRGGAGSDEEDGVSVDDKKKYRVSRVPINDGEEGEATLLQLRAKLFAFVKDSGWKERGAGNLKLNVPRMYVEYDENGVPILGSFDPSARNDSDEEAPDPGPISARLIMRQDNTHRVILNTVILKGITFEEKSSNSGGVQVTFTAIEDGSPILMLLRLNEANAKLFTSEIRSIQHEL